ncbi:MAG: B12-binding domain-containing radical SAM protein [Chthonomonadales bacterium]|nr:B12-binding domain-containing radical SAM protein [Chthonomonadales bacterium]
MHIRKIALVEPRAPGYHVYSRVALPRLGLPLLSALLRREGHQDIRVYCEDIAAIDRDYLFECDLVGISTTTSTAIAAYRLGSEIKRRNPRAVVVIGGVHATFMPDEAFDAAFAARHGFALPAVDYVVMGEAEAAFVDLVRSLQDGPAPSSPILGRRLRQDPSQRIDRNPIIADLDSLPFPDLASIVGRERMHIAPIATSRGCPFDCQFCSVIEMFGQRMRYRSVDPDDPRSVIAEMRQMRALNLRRVFFYDDNFSASARRTKTLLENIIRADVVPKQWTAQARATEVVRDREVLDLMRRTNCIMLYLGLESINPETLAEYNKKQSVEQVVEAIHVLREYGIRAHGMFVVGADGDTVETIRSTAEFAIHHDVSTIQFMILTPLPGTRCFEHLRDQGRILDDDWSHYDAHHTVFWPRHISPRDLQVETFRAMRRVYQLPRCAAPALRGNYLTGFFRLYGHNLVAKHVRRTREYAAGLPAHVQPAPELEQAVTRAPAARQPDTARAVPTGLPSGHGDG